MIQTATRCTDPAETALEIFLEISKQFLSSKLIDTSFVKGHRSAHTCIVFHRGTTAQAPSLY